MTIITIDSCLRRVTTFAACLLVTGWLAAQNVPAKPPSESKPVTTAAVQPAPTAEAATKPHDNTFVIGNDDVLAINVWKEPDISRSVPVRSDGKISLPLAGEIQAAGLTPLKLEQEIAAKLKNYIAEPEVTGHRLPLQTRPCLSHSLARGTTLAHLSRSAPLALAVAQDCP